MANEIPTPAEPVSPVTPSAIPSDLNASPEEILKAARSDSARAAAGMRPWHDAEVEGPKPAPAQPAPVQPAPANGMPTAFKPYTPAQDVNRPSPNPVMDSVDVPSSRSQDAKPEGAVDVPQAKDGYFKVLGEDLAEDAKGVGNGLMRGFAKMGKFATQGAAGLATLADKTVSKATGKEHTGAADAVFDFTKHYIDPAIDNYWKGPEMTNNPVGQVASGFAEFAPQMLAGAAAPVTSAVQAGTERAYNEIAAGHSVKTAAALATISGVQQFLFMNIPLKDPSIARRILKAAGLGVGVDAAGKETEKLLASVLRDPDYAAAVKNVDPLNPTDASVNALTQTVLAILHGKGALKPPSVDVPPATEAAGAPPPPPPPPPAAAAEPIKPVAPAPAAVRAPATPAPAAPRSPPTTAPAAPIPDVPSAESSKDLSAQFADAANPKTPRQGVLVTKGSMQALKDDATAEGTAVRGVIKKAQAQGRLVKTPNGDHLVMPSAESAAKARNELASGSDPQAVIGRITGAGTGKTADQTVVVQGKTPEGAVAKESLVAPAEVPAKVAEVAAEGKQPVVTTPEGAQARRMTTVGEQLKKKITQMSAEELQAEHEAKLAPIEEKAPVKGIAEVGKKEVPVHIEEGAPEGMVRVRPIGEDGELAATTHDIPKERVRTGEAAKPKPVETTPAKVPTEREAAVPEKVLADETAVVRSPLEEALAQHQAQETPEPGRKRIGKLSERQANAADFATALEGAAKENKAKAPDAVVDRAMKAAKAAKGLGLKSEEATAKGQGTSNARITAINEEMHKAARLLMGKGKPGDEVPAVAPKAAALKARTERAKAAAEKPKAAPKPKSPAAQAEAEVRAKYPEVEHIEEHVLAKRMLKKRTAEIEAEQAAAAKKAKSEMVEAPVYKEIEKTVTDEQLRKARNEATVDENQAKMSQHPTHIAKAEESKAIYDALKRQHDIEHGVALEPDQPKSAGEQAKVETAAKTHKELEQDYVNAKDEELPETWDKLVASAEKLLGRKMSEEELAGAKKEMDNRREIQKLTQEQAEDASLKHRMSFTTSEALQSKNPLIKGMAQMYQNMRSAGILRKWEDVRASGGVMGAHEALTDMIVHAVNPGQRAMLMRLRELTPDVAVRPTGSVIKGRSGEVNELWGGAYNADMGYAQFKLQDRPFTPETIIHELSHAATAHELNANPHGPLANEIQDFLDRVVIPRMGKVFGHDVIAKHMAYFEDTSQGQFEGFDRDFYGLANPKEFLAEYMGNPEFYSRLARLDAGGLPAGAEPTSVLGKIARIVAKFVTGGKYGTPIVEQAGEFFERVAAKQMANKGFKDLYTKSAKDFEEKLPYTVQQHQIKDALEASMEAMDGPDREALGNIVQLTEAPPKLPRGDADLGNIIDEDTMKSIRSTAALAREGGYRAVRTAKMSLTAEDQLMRRYRADFGHPDDPKNPLVQLETATDGRHSIRHEMQEKAKPIAEARLRLPKDVDKKLGQLQIDATMWGIDPAKPKDEQPLAVSGQKGFDARYDEFAKRWANTPEAAKKVFIDERDYLQWSAKKSHRAGVDAALGAYDMRDITPQQRALLYSVKDPTEYDDLIGSGKLIDIGESNDSVKSALKSMAGLTRLTGYYAPLARHGDYVVQAQPEGTKEFKTQSEAEAFAKTVNTLSPGSRGKVRQLGGKWTVDYKAEYVSFHRTPADAEADAARVRAAGFDVGHVTKKTYGEDNVPMTAGMKELVSEASRQINKGGHDAGSQALIENLRGAFLRMMANRSAYSASRLTRKSVAGVKAEEMGRNFAQHVQSTAFHTSALMTVFKEAEALGAVRAAARDQHAQVGQATMYRRGNLVEEIGNRMAQEARQYGHKIPGNAFMAKLGYANYLFSPAHTAINLTQNFTTAMPLASVRFGPGKATMAFARSMKLIAGPAFRTTFLAHIKPGQLTGRDVLNAVVEAIRKDPVHGKWARGENSPLQQLMDKGVITSTFSNELADIAKGENPFWGRVFEYARLLPHLSDVFNRTTTALAHLELSGGNVRHTADFVNETHVNYSTENMPRAFRAVKQVPVFGTSVVMFKTYMQGMAHLLYSMVRDSVMGARHVEGDFIARRANAAKTVGALMLGTALFTGLKGATPELVHLAAYAYNKVFGDKNKFWSFEDAMHHALADTFGAKAGELMYAGLPHAAGIDVSNRMGFNELMLHNPPDLLNADRDTFNQFVVDQLGTVPSLATGNLLNGWRKIAAGDVAGGLSDAVPIKLWQSVMSAYSEYTSGNSHQDGNMMIEPGNAYGAAMQAFGFKPAELANAQEKKGTAIEYRNFVKNGKDAIVGRIVAEGWTPENKAKRDAWNAAHADIRDKVTASDVFKLKQQKKIAELQTTGKMKERNLDIRKQTTYGD